MMKLRTVSLFIFLASLAISQNSFCGTSCGNCRDGNDRADFYYYWSSSPTHSTAGHGNCHYPYFPPTSCWSRDCGKARNGSVDDSSR